MKKTLISSTATLITLSTLIVGCGAVSPTKNAGQAPSTSTSTKNSTFKVGLVTDTGGLNDHGFNHLAYVGASKAQTVLGVKTDVVQSTSESDYVPNLTRYAQQGYNLVIAVGFLMDSAVKQVAKEYPNTKFLIIDDQIDGMSNVSSAMFNTEQCGYLIGAMAGLLEKSHSLKGMKDKNTVGIVGGQSIPPVNSYIGGFEQGFQKEDPSGKVILKYANSFSDQNLGAQFAQSEIASGADIIFPVAGGTGVGTIQAAKNAGVYAFGVDVDQNYLAPNTVLSSALKAVDTATYDVIMATKDGSFKAGPQFFNLANNGVDIALPSKAVPQDILSQVIDLEKQIKSGAIKVSPDIPK